jgi:hypothetical protein
MTVTQVGLGVLVQVSSSLIMGVIRSSLISDRISDDDHGGGGRRAGRGIRTPLAELPSIRVMPRRSIR